MTSQKHLKRRVRERMSQTGERYAAARRNVVGDASASGDTGPASVPIGGTHPETAALRSRLAHLGLTAPHTGRPWSEEMILGLGGGPGIGVFAFHYAAEDFASFYVAGRHLWDDSPAFLRAAARRNGVAAEVVETGSARTAASQLRDALAAGRGVIASVDLAPLGYRGTPDRMAGGGYHVVAVRAIDESAGTVEVEDLYPGSIVVPVEAFAEARARIRSQKHRLVLLSGPATYGTPALEDAVSDALRAAADGLEGTLDPAAGGRRGRNFSLDALTSWARRLHGDRSADGWPRMFAPGPRLWRGLASIYENVEHAATGGGLLRPMVARFLREAEGALGTRELAGAAERYEALGREWSNLARAALPASVPVLRETARLIERREQLFLQRGPAATADLRTLWEGLDAIEAGTRETFPLSGAEVDDLLADLAARVRQLESDERAAAEALRTAAGKVRGARA